MPTSAVFASGAPESGLLQRETVKGCGPGPPPQTGPCSLAKEKDVTSGRAPDPWTRWNVRKHRPSQTAGPGGPGALERGFSSPARARAGPAGSQARGGRVPAGAPALRAWSCGKCPGVSEEARPTPDGQALLSGPEAPLTSGGVDPGPVLRPAFLGHLGHQGPSPLTQIRAVLPGGSSGDAQSSRCPSTRSPWGLAQLWQVQAEPPASSWDSSCARHREAAQRGAPKSRPSCSWSSWARGQEVRAAAMQLHTHPTRSTITRLTRHLRPRLTRESSLTLNSTWPTQEDTDWHFLK